MSGCTGLRGQLGGPDAFGREPPRYKRLKPNLLGALEGEVIEIGPAVASTLRPAPASRFRIRLFTPTTSPPS